MKLAIMQPYFLPYLGYFQLMNACDKFVVYDNIQFTKKGWIHRNRMLLNGRDHMFSIPLQGGSDFLNVNERSIAENFEKERAKILGQVRAAYGHAPYYTEVYPLVERIFNFRTRNLFDFVFNSIEKVKDYLAIPTPLIISSSVDIDHTLKGKDKVIELCKKLNADTYINPIGGTGLYDKEEFRENNISLHFHKMSSISYAQTGNLFIPALSILDVMMFNAQKEMGGLLNEFKLE